LFADDLLIFTKGSVVSIKKINNILDMLAKNTGVLINKDKSKIFFSKGCSNKEILLQAVGVIEDKLPFINILEYLCLLTT